MKKTYILSYFKFIIIFGAFIFSKYGVSQSVQISIQNPNGVNVCDIAKTVQVNVYNGTSSTLQSVSIDLVLPTGIKYVSSSLTNLNGYNVQESNISNLSSIVLSTNNILADSTMQFTIDIEANMDAITYQNNGNVFRNDVTVNYTGGSSNKLSGGYNLYYPVLSILNITPTSQSVHSGNSVTRQITIINAGNGRVDGFTIEDSHLSGITLTSVNLGALNAGGNLITLSGADFSTVGNLDQFLDQNESIVITETLNATGCQSSTITSTITNYWGCNSSIITSSNSYAHVSISLKTPNISVSTSNELNSCFGTGIGSNHYITLTNNGQGKSINTSLDIFKSLGSNYDQNIFSRIDANNISYTLNGGASTSISPSSSIATSTSGDYSCLGNSPIGKVILSLPDLDPGDQIQIHFITYHCNINVCNGDYVKGWAYQLQYEDVCNSSSYSKNSNGQNENNTQMSIFPETPTDINSGETKEFNFTVSSFNNDLPAGTGAQYKVVFDIPIGLDYSSLEFYHNIVWSPSSINFNATSHQLTAYYDLPVPSGFNIKKAIFNLDLEGNCNAAGATSGAINIDLNISYIPNTTCLFEVPFICNESVSVDLHCPYGPGCEGVAFESFTFERISFGSPDNNLDGIPDASGSLDYSRIKTNRAMFSDTIRGTFTGTVRTSASNPNWQYGAAVQDIEKGTYLTPISASIRVFDQSSGSYFTCSNLPLSTNTTGADKEFTYNISPNALSGNCNAFSGFTYDDGDSIWVYADYKITTNIGGSVLQLKSTNEFYASNFSAPTAAQKMSCGYYNDHYTLIGYFFKNASRNYYNITSCSKTVSQNFYLSIGDCCSNYNGGDLFPSEYRNWAHIKTITVEIPANYAISNVKLKHQRTRKINSSVTEYAYGISPSSVNGNLYTFDIESLFNGFGGTIKQSDDGFKAVLYMDLSPNCDVPLNTYQSLEWKVDFHKSDFIGGGQSGFVEANNPDQVKFNPPTLNLSSANPIMDGVNKTVEWDLKIKTTSSSVDANYSWIHIKNPSGEMQIIYVIDDASGDTISISNDIYRIGTVEGSSNRDLTIIGRYGACTSDYITVYSGYECTSYPASFADFTCGFTSQGLFVEPKPAQMQVVLHGQNVGDECSDVVEIELDITSVKFGAVDSIQVSFNSTNNSMSFQNSSGQLLYPASGSYAQISNPTGSVSNYNYDLSTLNSTIGANGLPGILDLANNMVKLKFNMVMSPTFKPGDHAQITITGQTICGQTVPTINLSFDPSVGFQMITSAGITNDQINSWSSSWGDFNNDGYEDLFVTSYDENQPNILYKNNGDKTFSKITTGAIVTDLAKSVSSTWGDYDNDGYLDLFVANNVGSPNFLYHNNGNSTFTRITSGDIVNNGTYCHSAAWADYDNDGYLDLFVSEYFPTKSNLLFHNNGNGTFSKVQGSPVVNDAGHSIGAAWGDYNNDGLMDLFVPNTNNEPNWLYKNVGNGQFVKVNENVVSTASNSVGCSWGDYNNDGYIDMFIANSGNSNNFLYKNNGDGTFSNVTTGPVVNNGGHSHGSVWFDLDNDGDLDLFVTNDQGYDNFLYTNDGQGNFTRIENDLTAQGGNSFGTSVADYDNDGDYDLFVANHGNSTNFFFENTKGQCASYLCLNLIGSNSNYSAIGTKVKVLASIDGNSVWQTKYISSQTGGGAGGQNSSNLIFGLSDAESIDSLIIEWPSGFKKSYTNLSPTSSNCNTYTEDNGALVSGTAYVDDNNNCQYNIGETVMKNVEITIAPNGRKTYTDENGYYSFYMNTGDYILSAETPTYYVQSCPINNTHSVEVTGIGNSYPNNNFGFLPSGSQSDLSVCLSTTVLRINFTNDYVITYQNLGNTVSINNTITLNFATGIEIVRSTLPWNSNSGQTAIWSIDSIQPQESVIFYVTDSVTTAVTFGNYVTNSATITSNSSDADLSNNTCSDIIQIVGAIDPNDKLVYPEDVVQKGSPLMYKIRFQNVGNYPAESVIIYDTLSSDLNIASLSHVETSHPASFTIIDGNILKWDFGIINLPDSVHNEPKSHGFVQFKIYPLENLPEGVVIENSALILFDYYQKTPTNNTMVVIESDQNFNNKKNKLFIYPQPAYDQIILQYNASINDQVQLEFHSIIGKEIMSYTKKVNAGQNHIQLDISQYHEGMYTVILRSSQNIITQKILIVR
jgi:uncharacterized repeat protein (TIGR01451 family)